MHAVGLFHGFESDRSFIDKNDLIYRQAACMMEASSVDGLPPRGRFRDGFHPERDTKERR